MSCLEDLVEATCRSIVAAPSLHVKMSATDSFGYRNKITYSITDDRTIATSPLATVEVNLIANAVRDFLALPDLPVTPQLPRNFWCEVTIKVTRRGEGMVKVAFRNSITTLALVGTVGVPLQQESVFAFDAWLQGGEASQFVAFLQQRIPTVTCIVAHVSAASAASCGYSSGKRRRTADDDDDEDDELSAHLETKEDVSIAPPRLGRYCTTAGKESASQGTSNAAVAKPSKCDEYIPLTADRRDHVVEYTPNGQPFVLSPDSFCEVNHAMEDAIYQAIVSFLGLDDDVSATGLPCDSLRAEPGTACAAVDDGSVSPTSSRLRVRRTRRAFITGRDVNSVVKTFEKYYTARVHAVTTCPRVIADAERNGIAVVGAKKDEVWQSLAAMAQAPRPVSEEVHVLITAGRHGLHPNTTRELVRLGTCAAVDDVLYVSCNVESMIRDVYMLKSAFYLQHCRTFDFFPGTNFIMSVLHFRRTNAAAALFSEENPAAHRTANDTAALDLPSKWLLVIPIGPPGSGKSTVGRHLAAALQRTITDATQRQWKQRGAEVRRRTANRIVSITRLVDRESESPVSFQHVERDVCYRNAREAGLSLRAARQTVHEVLTNACTLSASSDTAATCRRTASANETCVAYRIVYLDSTNGNREGREHYRRCASRRRAGSTASQLASCLEVLFTIAPPPLASHVTDGTEEGRTDADDEMILARRCAERGSHPSFPSDVTEQREKIRTIRSAIENDDTSSPRSTAIPTVRVTLGTSRRGSSEAAAMVTSQVAAVTTWFAAFCAPDLASVLVNECPWNALITKWGMDASLLPTVCATAV